MGSISTFLHVLKIIAFLVANAASISLHTKVTEIAQTHLTIGNYSPKVTKFIIFFILGNFERAQQMFKNPISVHAINIIWQIATFY